MSKAEEKALNVYPIKIAEREGYDENLRERKGFVKGYHQAEKDLELTWEDMMLIHKCIKDAMNKYLYAFQTMEGQQKVYEDVLRRFKEKKGKGV